jgi:RimJ/RimL family protein N-acetyltransferase
MEFSRTRDFEIVRIVLTTADMYPMMGDDYLPGREEFQVNRHPDIWYVIASNETGAVGLFSLFPQNTVCWEVHVTMLGWAKTREKWEAARELVPWLRENTQCKRLTASIPEFNRRALIYGTHGFGMRYVGRHPKAFLFEGKLRDLILLGMPVDGS